MDEESPSIRLEPEKDSGHWVQLLHELNKDKLHERFAEHLEDGSTREHELD